MSAIYSIFTSPHHPPVPDHLPTLIVTPHGRPNQILYTYLHTNLNSENYLLTPSEAGDLCVAKLFPPDRSGGLRSAASSISHGSGGSPANYVRCEASRNLRWNISQTGIQNPIYKLTLPNPESPAEDQPLFQVSKPNPNATWWTIFYFAYAGHLIPPKRIEFGRIQKNPPEAGGGTRVAIMGKSDEEKAVWRTLGEGNEDMVEWIVVCAALVVLDDEIITAAEKSGVGAKMRGGAVNGGSIPPSPQRQRTMPPPQGSPMRIPLQDQPRSATAPPGHPQMHQHQQQQRMPPPQQPQFGGKDPRMQQQGPPPNGYPHPSQQRGPPPPQHAQQQHFPAPGPSRSRSPAPHAQQYPSQQPPPPVGYDQQQFPHPSQQPIPPQHQHPHHPHQQHQQQQQYPHPSQQQQPPPPPPQSSGSRQPSSYRPGPPRPGMAGAGGDWRV